MHADRHRLFDRCQTFKLPFSAALCLARESRPLICPNDGFERQLRTWEFCNYDVHSDELVPDAAVRKEKRAYAVWKAERDNLLKRGEEDVNRTKSASIASMAAQFGRRRQQARRNAEKTREQGLEESVEEAKRKEEWERVEQMEHEWNERLKKGLVMR